MTLVVVLVLTAIFDNVIIGVGLVAYDPQLLSGLYIGLAPIEDFAYAVVAPIVVGCISALSTWRRRA